MQVILFLSKRKSLNYIDFSRLLRPHQQFGLLASERVISQLDKEKKKFFHQIHLCPNMAMTEIHPIVEHYYKESQGQLVIITNDEASQLSTAYLNEEYKLKGIYSEKILPFTNKIIMKNKLAGSGLHIPQFYKLDKNKLKQKDSLYLETLYQQLKFPLIVKPLASASCIGVSQLTSLTQFKTWVETIIQDDDEYEIEEFFEGTQYNCDSIIQQGRCIFFSPGEYLHPLLDFKSGRPFGIISLPITDSRWKKLKEINDIIVNALQPPDGMMHFEVIETLNGEFVFIEAAARPSGSLVTPTEEKNLGINFDLVHFQLRLGLPADIHPKQAKEYYSWVYYPKLSGTILKIKEPPILSEYHAEWYVKIGEKTTLPENTTDKKYYAGLLKYHHPNREKLYEDFLKLREFQPIELEKADE
jgi:hypothetical protein